MPPHRRFEAPAGDGAVLAVPDFGAVAGLVEANRRLLDRPDVVAGGLPLRERRALARREIILAAWDYSGRWEEPPLDTDGPPVLVAGHQPELSHPGVWVKNFALHGLAGRLG